MIELEDLYTEMRISNNLLMVLIVGQIELMHHTVRPIYAKRLNEVLKDMNEKRDVRDKARSQEPVVWRYP